jgi:glucan phosphoethanolaminetransferase (alkaline phosphatase superfamily)
MNFFWLYDLSIWVLYIIVFVTFSSFSVFGYLITKKPLTKYFRSKDIEINDVISHFTGIIGIFFGILIGLVAVGVWENYNSSQEKADAESGNALALYRDCSGLPFQVSKVIKDDIKIYLNPTQNRVSKHKQKHKQQTVNNDSQNNNNQSNPWNKQQQQQQQQPQR